jgi:cobalt-zinc-cadmium efflux system outer membrane protein
MKMKFCRQNNKSAFWWVLSVAFSLLTFAAPIFAQSCMPLPDTLLSGLPLGLVEARLASCNRDVIAARRAFEAAGADRLIAGQRPNPTLTLGVNNINPKVGIGSGPLRDKSVDSSLRLDQLIERGDKAGLREQQAEANVRAAAADYYDVLRQQRLQTRTLYFELGYQQSRRRVMREFSDLAQATLKAAEKRFSVGDIAEIDLSRFRLDAARAENDARAAEIDFERARLDFARAVGAESQVSLLVVDEVLPPSALDKSAAVKGAEGAFELRADVSSARARVNAAEAASALARAISTRDVSVGAQFDRWPTTDANLQGTGNSFGITLTIPLFVRHANEGEARRAAVDLQTARDLTNRIESMASSEIKIAMSNWISAIDRSERVSQYLQPLAKRVAAAAEFAYSKGASSVLELLDARRNLKQAELDSSLSRSDTGKAWAQYSAAVEAMPKDELGAQR